MKVDKDRVLRIDKWASTLRAAGRQVQELVQEMRLLIIENEVMAKVSLKKDEEIERLKGELEWVEKQFKEEVKENKELVIH